MKRWFPSQIFIPCKSIETCIHVVLVAFFRASKTSWNLVSKVKRLYPCRFLKSWNQGENVPAPSVLLNVLRLNSGARRNVQNWTLKGNPAHVSLSGLEIRPALERWVFQFLSHLHCQDQWFRCKNNHTLSLFILLLPTSRYCWLSWSFNDE